MQIVDRGSGSPLVVIPGIQGRWEWFRPTIDELAKSFRVITFSLCDEPTQPDPLDAYVDQVVSAMDECGIERAIICGISFGGVVALRVAARHPARTVALVLTSTPDPSWRLRPMHAFFARWPRLCAPLFFLGAPFRLRAEVRGAIPGWRNRLRFACQQAALLVRAPLSPTRMAARAQLLSAAVRGDDSPRVSSPTLVLCGEHGLDHVVPVEGTLEYARLIRGSRSRTLEHTGHLGYLTRPRAFAEALVDFAGETERLTARFGSDAA